MKRCHGCNTDKEKSEFSKNKNRKDGLGTQCKKCISDSHKKWYAKNLKEKRKQNLSWYHNNPDRVRDNHLRYKFNITLDDYDRMYREQDGKCALCKKPESAKDGRSGKIRRLAVDHCHETDRVRGLLCYRCNHLIGCLGDTVESVQRVISYMERTLQKKGR